MKRAHLWIAGALFALAVSHPAWGQVSPHPDTPMGGPSSLPPGNGTIRGVVVDADAPGATAGLTVALYALQPDGTPGIGNTATAADGAFEFPGISNDPAIVYLIGARYESVPYGERTAFVAGQQVIDVMVPVKRPIADGSKVTILETTLRIESRGTRLAVEETHKIGNAGEPPVYVPEAGRAGQDAPFQAGLPEGAIDFQTGAFNSGEGFERRGDVLLYWGPLYAGEQELRYGYSLLIPPGASEVRFEKGFPLGTGRLRVLAPESGPRVASPDLVAGEAIDNEGVRLLVNESGAREPSTTIALSVQVPETSSDRTGLTLGRAEFSIELDDTILEVTANHKIEVASGTHLAGGAGDPLLRFDLPVQAEVAGLSTGAQQMGVRPADGGIEVYGPLGPGTHDLAFRYRLPAVGGSATLDLQFPMNVPTLLLRTADTGLRIENERLHRLRPEQMGTRMWMLREAFHVEPDEVLHVRFEALPQSGPSMLGGLFFVFVASAFVLMFVVSPLRRSPEKEEEAPEEDRSGLAHERDLLYVTIRDLEHDYETGKVSAEDYEQSRAQLREQAVALMREETLTAPAPAVAATRAATAVSAPEAASAPAAGTPTGGFCPSCSGVVDPAWRFCSHCGGTLEPASTGEASSSESTG